MSQQTFIADDKCSRVARSFLPDPTTTNDGPVAVVIVDGQPYRFHLASSGRSTTWKRVPAFGWQRCARQTCTSDFFVGQDAPMATIKRLYCSHTCRGRASEARRDSVRTAPFDAVAQTLSAASSFVPPAKPVKKTRKATASKASISSLKPFSF